MKEGRAIPNLIYAIEQYEKFLIMLTRKSKVRFLLWSKFKSDFENRTQLKENLCIWNCQKIKRRLRKRVKNFINFPASNSSCRKVMFSRASVNLFTGGGYLWSHVLSREGLGSSGWGELVGISGGEYTLSPQNHNSGRYASYCNAFLFPDQSYGAHQELDVTWFPYWRRQPTECAAGAGELRRRGGGGTAAAATTTAGTWKRRKQN